MSKKFSRRSFLTQSSIGASLFCLPSALFAKYEESADANDNDVVLRFSALSDVHFKKNRDCVEAERFARSMQFMYDYSAKQTYKYFDAMLVAGDMSDHGWDEELLFFKEVMDAGIKDGTTTIICMGNHEFIGGSKKRWEEIFERHSNNDVEVNGFKFIALSPEKGTCRNGDFLYAQDWYVDKLNKATDADPDKPIFTFQHYHITPTVYGSRGEDNWGTVDLYETLQKYPRVINFSGHSHYPINDPRSVWQGRFTAFGTGTLSYFEMGSEGGKFNKFPPGYRNAAQLYVVEVRRDNSVSLKPYDLITNSFFDVVYCVAQPGAVESYLYTDERYKTSEKPAWKDDAKATCNEISYDHAVLTFPQAECKDVVHSYRVDLQQKENDKWEKGDSFYFWSEYYFKDQPKEMKADVPLEPDSEYRANIVALNPFFKESEKALEISLTTPKDDLQPIDKNAPFPEANVLDVKFEGGKLVNAPVNSLKEQKKVEVFGNPEIVNYAILGGLATRFNGVDQRYRIKFTDEDYRRLGKITIAAKFKINKFRKPDNMVVFANTQGNGVSLEINGEKKTLEFWASFNGKYQIISAPVNEGEYIDAFGTYDGKVQILYINGKEVARQETRGRITYASDPSVQAFCIGSDIGDGGSGTNFFEGSVARARIFSWALNKDQVANLSK